MPVNRKIIMYGLEVEAPESAILYFEAGEDGRAVLGVVREKSMLFRDSKGAGHPFAAFGNRVFIYAAVAAAEWKRILWEFEDKWERETGQHNSIAMREAWPEADHAATQHRDWTRIFREAIQEK